MTSMGATSAASSLSMIKVLIKVMLGKLRIVSACIYVCGQGCVGRWVVKGYFIALVSEDVKT